MTNSENETEQDSAAGISDDQLPEDLQSGEDNPLAEPLAEDVDTAELDLDGGKTPVESDESDESDDEDLED